MAPALRSAVSRYPKCCWTRIRVKLICALYSLQRIVAEQDANWDDPEEGIGAHRFGGGALDERRAGGRTAGRSGSGKGRADRRGRLDRTGDDAMGRPPPRREAGLARLLAEPR